MSTTPSLSAISNMMSMTMKQPVRPAPALTHTPIRTCPALTIPGGCGQMIRVPAVDHSGAGGGRSFSLHTADEAQQASSMERNSVIRPTSEVKLSDLPDLCHGPLTHTHNTACFTIYMIAEVSVLVTHWVTLVSVCVCKIPSPQQRSGSHTLTAAESL